MKLFLENCVLIRATAEQLRGNLLNLWQAYNGIEIGADSVLNEQLLKWIVIAPTESFFFF